MFKTYKDMQEAFDLVVEGLAGQDWKQSKQDVGFGSVRCLYRGDHGFKCAVGLLLPDDLYEVVFPDKEVAHSCSAAQLNHLLQEKVGQHLFDPSLGEFMCDLQVAHDEGRYPEKMRENLRGVARCYDLSIPEALKE